MILMNTFKSCGTSIKKYSENRKRFKQKQELYRITQKSSVEWRLYRLKQRIRSRRS